MNESNVRIIINELLKKSDWILPGSDGVVNVDTEVQNQSGIADYILKDKSDFPLCVIEAKKEMISPLIGKEQARGYANSLNCRFVILSNGVSHYLWDIEKGSPNIIDVYPTQEQLLLRQDDFNPNRDNTEEIDEGYIANTQYPSYKSNPDYNNADKKDAFIKNNKLRLLRYYQLDALKAVKNAVADGKERFLLEMATGTGKTLTSSA